MELFYCSDIVCSYLLIVHSLKKYFCFSSSKLCRNLPPNISQKKREKHSLFFTTGFSLCYYRRVLYYTFRVSTCLSTKDFKSLLAKRIGNHNTHKGHYIQHIQKENSLLLPLFYLLLYYIFYFFVCHQINY